jgi:BirA family transcriptional regulator, biotin operon repressor / biotin---[acetyl-CoA-carboxylase] ligase
MKCLRFSNIVLLDTVDSTNTYCKRRYESLPSETVVFAHEQTSGKGRLDRKWLGEKGKGIYSSFLIKNIFENADAVRLSFLFSIAVKNFLSGYVPYFKIKLKWPNDVLIENSKICGILSEYSKNCVIAGIGINVRDFSPSEEIGRPWTTIQKVSGTDYDPAELAEKLVEAVNSVFERYCTNPISDLPMIWFRESGIKGQKLTVDNGNNPFSGSVEAIDDCGALIIKENATGKLVTAAYGDITYHD